MVATAAVAQSRVVIALGQIVWQDYALFGAGVLLLVLAAVVVYRRRRAEAKHARRVPLIERKSARGSPVQSARPAEPPPALVETRAAEPRDHAGVGVAPPPSPTEQHAADRSEDAAVVASPLDLTEQRGAERSEQAFETVETAAEPAQSAALPLLPLPAFGWQHEPERSEPLQSAAGAGEEGAEEVRAGLVRFHRPPEGTLQLLPGRLDIIAGKERVDVIRFVKVPGRDTIITFGRSRGEPHTHIQLQSPTVSRRHAAMRFHNGSWHIKNLSTTNPVVVRGKELLVTDAPVRLEDGDGIELGEVAFRFHARHVIDRPAEIKLVDRLLDELPKRLAEEQVDSSGGRRHWAAAPPHRPTAPVTVGRARTLTEREREVARMVADGKSNKAISEVLTISPRTVSTHLTNIFRKLDLGSRAELTDYLRDRAAAVGFTNGAS